MQIKPRFLMVCGMLMLAACRLPPIPTVTLPQACLENSFSKVYDGHPIWEHSLDWVATSCQLIAGPLAGAPHGIEILEAQRSRWHPDRPAKWRVERNFDGGKYHGTHRRWEGGELVETRVFDMGRPSGVWTRKFGLGSEVCTHHQEDDRTLVSCATTRGLSGELQRREYYLDDKPWVFLTAQMLWDSRSMRRDYWPIASEKHRIRHGRSWTTNVKGEVIADGHYIDGQPDGEFTSLDRSNNLVVSTHDHGKRVEKSAAFVLTLGDTQSGKRNPDEQLHGVWEKRNAEGELLETATYINDVRHGRSMSKLADGKVVVGLYENGEKNGIWDTLGAEDRVTRRTTYLAGKRHGLELSFGLDGAIQGRGHYLDDKRDGDWRIAYEDGSYADTHYRLGSRDGLETAYWPNGKKQSKGPWRRGQRYTGTWTEWYADGAKKSEGQRKGYRKVGVWKTWYPSGQPMSETHLTGRGINRNWSPKGELVAETTVRNGKKAGGSRERSLVFKSGASAAGGSYSYGSLEKKEQFLDDAKVVPKAYQASLAVGVATSFDEANGIVGGSLTRTFRGSNNLFWGYGGSGVYSSEFWNLGVPLRVGLVSDNRLTGRYWGQGGYVYAQVTKSVIANLS